MILSCIELNCVPAKRTEVFQSLASLAVLVRGTRGCLRCSFFQDGEDDAAFALVEEWQSREDLDAHLHSPVFAVLIGLTPSLREPVDISVFTIASRAGIEVVKQARGQAAAAAQGVRA